jgi:hypothetical protein
VIGVCTSASRPTRLPQSHPTPRLWLTTWRRAHPITYRPPATRIPSRLHGYQDSSAQKRSTAYGEYWREHDHRRVRCLVSTGMNMSTLESLVSAHCEQGHNAVQRLVSRPTGVNRVAVQYCVWWALVWTESLYSTVSGEYWCEQSRCTVQCLVSTGVNRVTVQCLVSASVNKVAAQYCVWWVLVWRGSLYSVWWVLVWTGSLYRSCLSYAITAA